MSKIETIIQALEYHAGHSCNKNVIQYNNTWISYGEIYSQSKAICAQLLDAGVKHGEPVGVYSDRNLELPALILGILMSGAICVPFDPSYPEAFLKELSQIVSVKKVLCNRRDPKLGSLDIEQIIQASPGFEYSRPVKISPDDGAFILFTSGSSGKPNAVLRTHKAIMSPLKAWEKVKSTYSMNSRMLLRSPITHSPFLWEFFYPVFSGIEMVIAPEEAVADPNSLADLVQACRITHLTLSPVHIHAFIELKVLHKLRSLVEVDCSGESLSIELIRKFKSLNNAKLASTYGCTECPGIASQYFDTVPAKSNSLGSIRNNVILKLLDQNFTEVTRGNTGEIYLSGDRIASGYFNNPIETKKKFIKLTLPGEQERVYFKTGDLARETEPGQYEFLGRADSQVQLHGFRIEPEEVETALLKNNHIQTCIVNIQTLKTGRKVLAAFYTSAEKKEEKSLRKNLEQQLPRHKVPAYFIQLTKIPRNNHNKIDTRELKLLFSSHCNKNSASFSKAAMSKTEKKLLNIWVRVLKNKNLQVNDDFFLEGGDSLSSIFLLEEIKKKLNLRISLEAFIENSSIRELAAYIDSGKVSKKSEASFLKKTFNSIYKTEFGMPRSMLARQKKLMLKWAGEYKSRNNLISGLNTNGTRLALFWCCQGYREFNYLASLVDRDQPIYGIRSGAGLFKSWEAPDLTKSLARHYLQEISNIAGLSSIILGGNCQAGEIVKEMVLHSKEFNIDVSMTVLLNPYFDLNIPGSLKVFYGEESKYNPFKNKDFPALESMKEHVDFVSGNHLTYFTQSSNFTAKLLKILKEPESKVLL